MGWSDATVSPTRNKMCIRDRTYHCATCGTDSDVSMPAADIAAVNRIVAMGNDAEAELPRLRRQYRNLDISSWDKENRLQTK